MHLRVRDAGGEQVNQIEVIIERIEEFRRILHPGYLVSFVANGSKDLLPNRMEIVAESVAEKTFAPYHENTSFLHRPLIKDKRQTR